MVYWGMKILGIDPGIGRVGYGLIETKSTTGITSTTRIISKSTTGITSTKGTTSNKEFGVGKYGCFETHPSPEASDGKRLYEIHCFLKELIEKEKPDEVAVESLFFAQNVKTAMMVSQARGAILLTVAQAGLPVFSYTPLQVKQALTGYGRAEKKQVQKMVQVILGMKECPKQDDAADALAVGITHAFSRRLGKLMK